jgi:hypothetical protein
VFSLIELYVTFFVGLALYETMMIVFPQLLVFPLHLLLVVQLTVYVFHSDATLLTQRFLAVLNCSDSMVYSKNHIVMLPYCTRHFLCIISSYTIYFSINDVLLLKRFTYTNANINNQKQLAWSTPSLFYSSLEKRTSWYIWRRFIWYTCRFVYPWNTKGVHAYPVGKMIIDSIKKQSGPIICRRICWGRVVTIISTRTMWISLLRQHNP